ncbi:MAG: arginase [Clostridiaceae bacterium]|nr:arginase [Clostridiaceae bacterium]
MGKCLLSIDWDYFIHTHKDFWGSYIENTKNIINMWYKRYIKEKAKGKDIQKFYSLSNTDTFWRKIKKHFTFTTNVKAYVSDSHALSYDIAKNYVCKIVYLFDAHSDLGYGGLPSLNFEVNCANWLGKLLKDGLIDKANIIYSPYTAEKPEFFKSINNAFNVNYINFENLGKGIEVLAVHICRSGAWTPPWFDKNFFNFIEASGIKYEIKDCPVRKWDTENISISDQIFYLMA